LRILFIVFNIVGRGTYLRAYELARALTKLGHDLTLLASSEHVRRRPKTYVQEGIQIIEVSDMINGPTRSGWDVVNLMDRVNRIKQQDYDLVHGFESRPTVIYPALALRKRGVPLFLDWADWFGSGGSIEERPNPMIRMLLRPFEDYYETHFRKTPHGTTVICQTLAQRAINLGIPENEICILPNGFNIEDWNPIPVQQARTLVNLEHSEYLVGYLGSFFPNDAELTINTVNQLNATDQQIKLVHVGHSNYHIKDRVKNPPSVIETGPVSFQEMQTFLSACDVLLLPFTNSPANNGRFPLKFSNYLACGRPIVATQVGDIPGYIKQFNLGTVTYARPEALVKAIIDLKGHPEFRSKFGQAALELSQDPQESWLSRAEKLTNFYIDQIEGQN
jgi:glycosyltransferase involved in cell wall biosynthesis